ncbi:MAG: transcription elongation factor GreB [Gammaproteobacteria bacterium]|nr:transcription elongation factor GreB [Gammaproteobacteria bacterium]
MSRYRAPAPAKSAYITTAGMELLRAEEKALWSKRREVVLALSAAAAEGDRSENAEYIYRKKELREIDRRIRYLQKRLPKLTVVSSKPARNDQVFFGATVSLEDESGQESIYCIVGPDEFDRAPHFISVDSPLARSLMKRLLDDEVVVQTPGGTKTYIITEIQYGQVSE